MTVIGVLGDGQLARMMIPPAIELGLELRVLGSATASAGPAVTSEGDYADADAVSAFAREVDVITFDHEHVPQPILERLVAEGVAVRPGPAALRCVQDKLVMRAALAAFSAPMPAWRSVASEDELAAFMSEQDARRVVVKTPRGGYDGKGVRVVEQASEVTDWFAEQGTLLAEAFVPFRRELAQLVARTPSGEIAYWPVVQTVQRDGVCSEVYAPAPGLRGDDELLRRCASLAAEIAERLDVVGVLAVELFETETGEVLINELAMRPHNSGHWTIDGSRTSQFEQHLRAVSDLPLGETSLSAAHTCMVNVLGGPQDVPITDRFAEAWQTDPGAKLHTYGKTARPGRKVGHVTVVDSDEQRARARAVNVAAVFAD